MRGYFGVGVDGISKPMNLGNLVRIAHAFDASFFFSIAPRLKLSDAQSDTSRAQGALPFYSFAEPSDLRLPLGCRLVGVEITDAAVELPRFPPSHPGGLCVRRGAILPVAPGSEGLRFCRENPHPILHQCRHGGRHRALRPVDLIGRLWRKAGRDGRAGRRNTPTAYMGCAIGKAAERISRGSANPFCVKAARPKIGRFPRCGRHVSSTA